MLTPSYCIYKASCVLPDNSPYCECHLGCVVNADPDNMQDCFHVFFLSDHLMALAEMLIFVLDISQHILTASTKASGMSSMKFCISAASSLALSMAQPLRLPGKPVLAASMDIFVSFFSYYSDHGGIHMLIILIVGLLDSLNLL